MELTNHLTNCIHKTLFLYFEKEHQATTPPKEKRKSYKVPLPEAAHHTLNYTGHALPYNHNAFPQLFLTR